MKLLPLALLVLLAGCQANHYERYSSQKLPPKSAAAQIPVLYSEPPGRSYVVMGLFRMIVGADRDAAYRALQDRARKEGADAILITDDADIDVKVPDALDPPSPQSPPTQSEIKSRSEKSKSLPEALNRGFETHGVDPQNSFTIKKVHHIEAKFILFKPSESGPAREKSKHDVITRKPEINR